MFDNACDAPEDVDSGSSADVALIPAKIIGKVQTVLGAATIAGAYWGLLRAVGFPMGALVVSHVAWDIWIFLIAPTQEVAD